MTAVMIGEGQALVDGKVVPGLEALAAADLARLTLGPKEGLALINGTQFSTAYAISGLLRAHDLACATLVTGALSVDAAMASTAPFRSEIQELRGHAGQIAAGAALTALLAGSDIRNSHLEGDERVQDPYCLRCQPQVAGAVLDLLMQAARTLTIEANAVTDNPLVLVETGDVFAAYLARPQCTPKRVATPRSCSAGASDWAHLTACIGLLKVAKKLSPAACTSPPP